MLQEILLAHSSAPTRDDWTRQLTGEGYCILRDLVPRQQMESLSAALDDRFRKTPFCMGQFSGGRTKRFHALLNRCDGAVSLVLADTILGIVRDVLLPFADTIQLNLTQAIEIHPGEVTQIPHRDQNMWGGEKGRIEYLINVMWPLTAFTRVNGATRLWARSHLQQEQVSLPDEQAITPELFPGDALMFLGSTLHCAGANTTLQTRRGIIVSYSLGWLKPYENMWLTYPPHVAKHFAKPLQELIGYCRHRPNLGNYDGNCPSVLLDGDPGDYLATTDLLLEPQVAQLQRHIEKSLNQLQPRTDNAA